MKKISLYILSFLVFTTLQGQDPEFTQFYNLPLYTNPAYAGSALNGYDGQNATRINLAYRNQWQGTYQTINTSWDRHFTGIRGGVGGFITRDVAGSGLLTTTSSGGMYAPTFYINDYWTIRAAGQLSFVHKQLDLSRVVFADQINPTQGFVYQTNEPLPQQSVSFMNTGFGAIAYHKKYHFGFAVHNILEPNQSFYGSADVVLPRRYTMHAGADFPILKLQDYESSINPYILYMNQQNFNQLNASVNLNVGRILVGSAFRQTIGQFGNADALIFIAGYKAPRYHFTYSYDLTISSARAAAKGSHEFSMNYFISLKKNYPDLELTSPSY